MSKKESIDNSNIYMDDEDYEKKIKGLPKIEKINKFMEENLDSFDAYALVAINNSDNGAHEDNEGELCRGTICMKLGSPEDAGHFFDTANTLKAMKIKPTIEDYKTATLAQLVQHLVEAHCGDKEEALKFVRTLSITMAHMGDIKEKNVGKHSIFENSIDRLRDKLLNNFDLDEAIILADTTVEALDEWKKILPEIKRRREEQLKKEEEKKDD